MTHLFFHNLYFPLFGGVVISSMATVLPKVGIVGSVEYVLLLAPLLKEEGFSLTAIWCRNRDMSQHLADKFSVPHCPGTFQDLLVLRDVDLVYVAAEPLLQAEITVKALTSGKHCVCVKPPSFSIGEVEKMLSLSLYYGQLHSVLEAPLEFIPSYLKLKRIIQDGSLGNVIMIDVTLTMGSLISSTDSYSWKCDPSLGGGVLNLLVSHIIGTICNIGSTFSPVKRVNCILKTFTKTTSFINGFRTILSDDYCSLQLELNNGVYSSIVVNTHYGNHYSYTVTVNCTKGRAIIRGMDLYIQENEKHTEILVHKEEIATANHHQYADEAKLMNVPLDYYYSMIVGTRGVIKSLGKLFTDSDDSATPDSNEHQPLHKRSLLGLSSFETGHHVRAVLDAARSSSMDFCWKDIPLFSADDHPLNPFWTTSYAKIDVEKPSPKLNEQVSYV